MLACCLCTSVNAELVGRTGHALGKSLEVSANVFLIGHFEADDREVPIFEAYVEKINEQRFYGYNRFLLIPRGTITAKAVLLKEPVKKQENEFLAYEATGLSEDLTATLVSSFFSDFELETHLVYLPKKETKQQIKAE